MKKIILLLLFCIFILSCETQDYISESNELKEKLHNLIQDEISPQIPGIQLSVKHPKYGIISVATGLANIADNITLSTKHNLRIASATKLFTATLIMKLVEDNILMLDNTIEQLLDDIKFATADKITVRNLLQHTSGFIGYFNDDTAFQNYVIENPYKIYEPKTLVEKALKLHVPEEAEIGVKFYYNNTNYVILGMIIEKYFQKSYQESVHDQIAEIINLNYTSSLNDLLEAENMAEGYIYLEDEPLLGNKYNHSFLFSSGNIVSRTSDLVKFIDSLMKNEILTRESLIKMQSYITNDDGALYGLGIAQFIDLGTGHNGLTLGYSSIIVYNEEHDLSIAVLMNALSSDTNPEAVARKALLIITEK